MRGHERGVVDVTLHVARLDAVEGREGREVGAPADEVKGGDEGGAGELRHIAVRLGTDGRWWIHLRFQLRGRER